MHMKAGLLMSFILIWDLLSKRLVFSPVILPIALASSTPGAVLPDIIKPPGNRHHRTFFHTLLFLALLLVFLKDTCTLFLTGGLADEVTFGLFFAGAGFVSHMVLDALTPAELSACGIVSDFYEFQPMQHHSLYRVCLFTLDEGERPSQKIEEQK